jgi:hypothetical protein
VATADTDFLLDRMRLKVRRMEFGSFYQELIREHSHRPPHADLRKPFDAEVHHNHPIGEDEMTLSDADSEPVLADVPYEALGCSISRASASIMADHNHRQDRRRGDGRAEQPPRQRRNHHLAACRAALSNWA